jgi:hypothetical protein
MGNSPTKGLTYQWSGWTMARPVPVQRCFCWRFIEPLSLGGRKDRIALLPV